MLTAAAFTILPKKLLSTSTYFKPTELILQSLEIDFCHTYHLVCIANKNRWKIAFMDYLNSL